MPTFVYPASATVGVSSRRRSLPARRALALDALQPPLEQGDAAAREAAVGLELRLARAARADAAAEPLEVLPEAAHPRQVVLELRELDLELALGADGVLGEDVEDQLRAVDHARCRARPRGTAAAPGRARRRRAGSRPRSRRSAPSAPRACPCRRRCAAPGGPVLDDAADRLDARRARELLDLGELVVGVRSLGQNREDEPALGLRGTWNHRAIMPAAGRSPILAQTDARARRHRLAVARGGAALRLRHGARPAASASTTTASRCCTRSAPAGRSCCSRATRTRFRRRGTCPAGSRTAPSTASARRT